MNKNFKSIVFRTTNNSDGVHTAVETLAETEREVELLNEPFVHDPTEFAKVALADEFLIRSGFVM